MSPTLLCIAVGTALHSLPARGFTLQWQHTIERVLWEEDYLVAGDWLYLSSARVRGSGAGMEPPDDSVLVGDAWHYRPALRWHRRLELARSTIGADYQLCVDGRCRPIESWVPRGPTTIAPCPAGPSR